MKLCKKIIVVIFLCAITNVCAQSSRTGPLAVDYEIIKGLADSALVIVRQEYKLVSENDEYVWGDKDYFGRGYSVGFVSNNRIYVEKESLSPWKNDTLYRRFSTVDTLVPMLRKTFVRPVWDTVYTQVIIQKIDTFENGSAALYLRQFPFQVPSMIPADTTLGLAVLVQPSNDIRKFEKTPLKIIVLSGQMEKNQVTGEYSFPAGTTMTSPLGGVFFTWKNYTGHMKLFFGGLLKRSLLNYRLIPFMSSNTEESANGAIEEASPLPQEIEVPPTESLPVEVKEESGGLRGTTNLEEPSVPSEQPVVTPVIEKAKKKKKSEKSKT